MAKFTVKSRIELDHRVYEKGDLIELNGKLAKELAHAIEEPREDSKPPAPVALADYVANRDFPFGDEPVKKGGVLRLTPAQAAELSFNVSPAPEKPAGGKKEDPPKT